MQEALVFRELIVAAELAPGIIVTGGGPADTDVENTLPMKALTLLMLSTLLSSNSQECKII